MALTKVISLSDARTPLAQKNVRRSTRLSIGKEGFAPVRIEKEPSKKAKNWVVQVDESTGEIGPVSLEVLKDWGIKCGVDPSDLTDNALMQAPSPSVTDVNEDE